MIKLAHTHENGKVCYKVIGGYKNIGMYQLAPFAPLALIAYKPYTGHWYCFDEKTGRELATFTAEFYDQFLKPNLIDKLVKDKDCEPIKNIS